MYSSPKCSTKRRDGMKRVIRYTYYSWDMGVVAAQILQAPTICGKMVGLLMKTCGASIAVTKKSFEKHWLI